MDGDTDSDGGAVTVDTLEAENERLKSMMELLMKKTSFITEAKAKAEAEAKAAIRKSVKVFHFIAKGESREGLVPCGNIRCDWTYSDHLKALTRNFKDSNLTLPDYENDTITLSVYNMHSLWDKRKDTKPALCDLATNITMAESEEPKVRFTMLFEQSFRHFDGHSTTSPLADIQRVSPDAFLNTSSFLPMKPFASLIKGASYIASDCHKKSPANSKRDSIVLAIRELEFRVDGLGKSVLVY